MVEVPNLDPSVLESGSIALTQAAREDEGCRVERPDAAVGVDLADRVFNQVRAHEGGGLGPRSRDARWCDRVSVTTVRSGRRFWPIRGSARISK